MSLCTASLLTVVVDPEENRPGRLTLSAGGGENPTTHAAAISSVGVVWSGTTFNKMGVGWTEHVCPELDEPYLEYDTTLSLVVGRR